MLIHLYGVADHMLDSFVFFVRQFDADHYMDMIESFHPDWFQALCDSDTDHSSSKKRIKKSVDRTISYLDKCIERVDSSEVRYKYSLSI